MSVILKDSLTKLREDKERSEVKKFILENRILSVFENDSNIKYFDGLTKREKLAYSIAFINEINNIKKEGLISEGLNLFSLLGGLFGKIFPRVIETAAEPLVDSILKSVGFKSEGYLKKFVISLLTSNPADLIHAFTDCETLTKLISRSLAEGVVMMLQDEVDKSSFFYNSLRNSLNELVQSSGFITSIENGLQEKVCSMFSKFSDRAEGVIEKLKNK